MVDKTMLIWYGIAKYKTYSVPTTPISVLKFLLTMNKTLFYSLAEKVLNAHEVEIGTAFLIFGRENTHIINEATPQLQNSPLENLRISREL
jgi:hypothetical protein